MIMSFIRYFTGYAMTDDITGDKALALRMQAFAKSIDQKSEIELFELFHDVTAAQETAPTGSAEGQTEDLLLKSLAVETLISRHNNGGGLTKYNDWLASRKAKSK
jgi:hypothetical protein